MRVSGERASFCGHLANKPRGGGPFRRFFVFCRLLERTANRSEFVVQCRAEVIDDGDDRQRDTRRDQPVFNRGGTTFICHEALENGHSIALPCVLCRLT